MSVTVESMDPDIMVALLQRKEPLTYEDAMRYLYGSEAGYRIYHTKPTAYEAMVEERFRIIGRWLLSPPGGAPGPA